MPDQKQGRPDPGKAPTGREGVPSRPTGEPSGEEKEQFRQPSFWYNEKDRQASFEMDDARWRTSEQIKDWIKLAIMVALTIAWSLFIYFLAPGLR